MRNFIKYLVTMAAPIIALAALLCLGFSGCLPKIADIVYTGTENMFSFIQNKTVRDVVIIALMFLVYIVLRWVLFKLATRKLDE